MTWPMKIDGYEFSVENGCYVIRHKGNTWVSPSSECAIFWYTPEGIPLNRDIRDMHRLEDRWRGMLSARKFAGIDKGKRA